jgi:hypothetical protein
MTSSVSMRVEPSVPATFKIPRDLLAQLRTYSASSGLTLRAIVTLALEKCLNDASASGTWLAPITDMLLQAANGRNAPDST